MKTIVVYISATGFTQKYAQWIAARLQCQALPLKQVSAARLADYDTVIFGSWINAEKIAGLKQYQQLKTACAAKNLFVFCTGGTDPQMTELIDAMREKSGLDDVPFFYFQGGLNYEKMGFLNRLLLKVFARMLKNKKDKTPDMLQMEKMIAHSFDASDENNIQPLIAAVANAAAADKDAGSD